MKLHHLFLCMLAVCVVAIFAADLKADRYTTNMPGGADAELRESSSIFNRGDSTEIASRIAGTSRMSLIYLKFGVGDISAAELAGDIKVHTTYRNTNLGVGRFQDLASDPQGPNTGFDYYVLDPTVDGADWDEMTIGPTDNDPNLTFVGDLTVQPPGYVYDGDYTTKPSGTPASPTAGLTYLGTKLFENYQIDPDVNRLVVGDNFDLITSPGSALHSAIVAAQGTAHQTVTVVMCIAHEADNPNSNWLGFNYLFNPKEQTTLNGDPESPYDGASNANGEFSPALLTVPEPTGLALLCLGGLALVRRRR